MDWQLLWLMLASWKWTTCTLSKEKPEFSTISIDDCINTLQIISGHMSHLISLESRELCCWFVEETWMMALYRCQFFSANVKCLGVLTLRRMTDWGTPISNHENACWNVHAFFDRLALQRVTHDCNNCTLTKLWECMLKCIWMFFLPSRLSRSNTWS